jgi:hypothetical protein
MFSSIRYFDVREGGRTRTDKTGVGAGAGDDIGGTDISCHCMAKQYTRLTRQSYRNDPRHVGVRPAPPPPPDKYAGLVRREGAHSSSMRSDVVS